MATKLGPAHLLPAEVTLLGYAADDSCDIAPLTDKEALVLQLANQIQEQRLEKALLEQGTAVSICFFLGYFLRWKYFFDLTSSQSSSHFLVIMWKNSSRSPSASYWRRDLPTPSGGRPFVPSS
jgi:hypothetical protein